MSMKDYYKTLGVAENAGDEEIKKAYRRLAKECHPDAHPGDKRAEERFKEVSEAYQVLGNPQKRQKYDQMRKYGGGFDFGSPGSGNTGFRGFEGFGGFGRAGQGEGFSFEGFDLFGNLGDLFTQFFDRGERVRRERYGPRQGEDVLVTLSIPFELAADGGKTGFSVEKEYTCPVCQGGGAKPGSRVETCQDCRGTGMITIGQGNFGVSKPCPRCFGRGQIIRNPCERCQGSGVVNGKRTYSVNIPSGIQDGEQIRLKGQGNPGTGGGTAGNMLVTVRIESHHFYTRKDSDVYCTVPLTSGQAAHGAKVKIRTLSGQKVLLRIPPKTRDGNVLRLAGMGVQQRGKKGDCYVTVRVVQGEPASEEKEMKETA